MCQPSWMSDRTWAPTWNHMGVQFVADFEFHEDVGVLREILRDMIDTMEAGRPKRWHLEETGAPIREAPSRTSSRFDAHVRETQARLQARPGRAPADLPGIVKGLAENGEPTWWTGCSGTTHTASAQPCAQDRRFCLAPLRHLVDELQRRQVISPPRAQTSGRDSSRSKSSETVRTAALTIKPAPFGIRRSYSSSSRIHCSYQAHVCGTGR